MKIKIGNFNFISKDTELRLSQYDILEKFNNFYMAGKEDTLYVTDRSKFDEAKEKGLKFEEELVKTHYIIEYPSKIRNAINTFIKEKALKLYMNNNYSRYDLYNNIGSSEITKETLERRSNFNSGYSEKITSNNKLKCVFDGGYELIFDPYTEKIDNLEDLYKQGFFNETIKNNLLLLEIERNKAPGFVKTIVEIKEFLKEKQTVNMIFKDGNKVKVEARISEILYLSNNNIRLENSPNKEYKIDDLEKLMFNRTELKINADTLINLREQIILTTADMLSFKIDDMKEELYQDFRNYEKQASSYLPGGLEVCISIINEIEDTNKQIEDEILGADKEDYPLWYKKEEFEELRKEYYRIKTLENINSIDDIKEIARETGDNDLQKIYYILSGEELEEAEEEEFI